MRIYKGVDVAAAVSFLYDFETNSVSIQRELSLKVVVHDKADATIENVDAGHCVVEVR